MPAKPNVYVDQTWILEELDKTAMSLFQLRKVGVFTSIPEEVREGLVQMDPERAKNVFALIDGDQDYAYKRLVASETTS